MAAAHIINRCYNQRINETQYDLLTGNKPNISKMHVFGTVCFPYVQIKKKLDPRCRRGIFVGYDKNSPSYLVYFSDTNTVTKNHTVKFTEQYEEIFNKKNEVIQHDYKENYEIIQYDN